MIILLSAQLNVPLLIQEFGQPQLLRELALPIPVQLTDADYWRLRARHAEPQGQPYSSSYSNGDRVRRRTDPSLVKCWTCRSMLMPGVARAEMRISADWAPDDEAHLADLEDAMIQEALRLSLVEEEQRQARARQDGNSTPRSTSDGDDSSPERPRRPRRRQRHAHSSDESSSDEDDDEEVSSARTATTPRSTNTASASLQAAPASPRTISSSVVGIYETDRSDNDDASI